MANLAASTIKRPGTIVTTAGSFSIPPQLESHAVAYMFVTVPFGQGVRDSNGNWVENYESQSYSELIPNVPTQVTSIDDYLSKIGGEVPDPVKYPGAWVSYQSVKLFFRNAGTQGVLYVIRVPLTPEVQVRFSAVPSNLLVKYVSLKIGDRYVGEELTDIATKIRVDNEDRWIIKTSGLNPSDIAYDVYRAILADRNISSNYIVKQTAAQVNEGHLSIYSKTSGEYPIIPSDKIRYYASSTATNASGGTAYLYTSKRRINFRLAPTSEIVYADLTDQNKYNNIPTLDNNNLNAQLQIIYRIAAGLSTNANIADRSLLGLANAGEYSRYYYWNSDNNSFVTIGSSIIPEVPTANNIPGSSYSPKPIQIFYVNIAGENRAIIVDGTDNNASNQPAKVSLFSERIATEINNILMQKGIEDYYEISYSNWDLDVPNASVQNEAVTINNLPNSERYISIASTPTKTPVTATTTEHLDANYTAGSDQNNPGVGATLTSNSNGALNVAGFAPTVDTRILVKNQNDPVHNGIYIVSNTGSGSSPWVLTRATDYDQSSDTTGNDLVRIEGTAEAGNRYLYNGGPIAFGTTPINWTLYEEEVDAEKAPGTSNLGTGFKTYDYVAWIDVLSKIGSPAPISAGTSRSGNKDTNVVTIASTEQPSDYLSSKNSFSSKKQDYIVSIESSIDPDRYEPGFLLCPEAFYIFSSSPDGLTRTEARSARLDIASALRGVASGTIVTENFGNGAGFQSLGAGTSLELIALIDCGKDIVSHLDAQLELQFFKDSIGDALGHAAYYAPYLNTIDEGNPAIPPSAGVAGIALARYSQEGFQQPPAGTKYSLKGVQGVSFKITSQQQEVSNALGLNAIRSLPNKGICVWGSRTMSSNPLYKFVNTRVILNVLIRALGKSFDDLLFDVVDGTGTLFNRVKNIGFQICNQLYQNNALYGAKPEEAYSVICDSSNNSSLDLENGTVKLDIYVVPSPTLERIIINVTRTPIGLITAVG